MAKVYSPELEHTITIPDYCILCGHETRKGRFVYVDEVQYWVCERCFGWADREDIDLEEEIRREVS